MSEKINDYGDEKIGTADSSPNHELAEQAGRRSSVALNIVENPLKVCLAIATQFSSTS